MRALALLLLVACGTMNEAHDLQLQLRVPLSLKRSSLRYQRFLDRVTSLEVEMETVKKGRVSRHNIHFPVSRWEALFVPLAPSQEVHEITVRVWDRDREGRPRSQPALVAQKRLTQKERKERSVELILRPQVSLRDYD